MIVAGGGSHGIQTGRQIQCSNDTPLANLWLTLADQMGVKLNQFADSTGHLSEYTA